MVQTLAPEMKRLAVRQIVGPGLEGGVPRAELSILYPELPGTALELYALLRHYATHPEEPHPHDVETLSAACPISRGAINRGLQQLEAAGLVQWSRRARHGRFLVREVDPRRRWVLEAPTNLLLPDEA